MASRIETQQNQGSVEISIPFMKPRNALLLSLAAKDHNFRKKQQGWFGWGISHRECTVEIVNEEIRTGGVVIPNSSVVIKAGNPVCWLNIWETFQTKMHWRDSRQRGEASR